MICVETTIKSDHPFVFHRTLAHVIILVLLAMTFGSSRVLGQEAARYTFGWWSALTYDQQVLVVGVEINGFDEGWVEGTLRNGTVRNPKRPHFSHTLEYYAAAISDFYILHPGAHGASVADILGCLEDDPFTSCASVAHFYETH